MLSPGRKYGIMMFLYFAGVAAVAQTPLRNSFDSADMLS